MQTRPENLGQTGVKPRKRETNKWIVFKINPRACGPSVPGARQNLPRGRARTGQGFFNPVSAAGALLSQSKIARIDKANTK